MTTKHSLRDYFNRLIEEAAPPTDPRAEGLRRHAAGDAEGALPLLLAAERADGQDREVSLALGRILLARGEACAALERLELAFELQPLDAAIAYALGEAHRLAGALDAARAAFERAVALRPAYTDAHIQLGLVLMAQGRDEAAIKAFEQAIFLDRQALVARYQLATICLARKEYARATAQLHVLKQLRPDYAPIYVLAAEAAEQQGHHRQALDELGRLVTRKLADARVHHRIGVAHWKLKQPAQALAAFTKAIALGDAPVEASCYAAQAHEALGQLEQALELYKRLAVTPRYQLFGKKGVDRVTLALARIAEGLAA